MVSTTSASRATAVVVVVVVTFCSFLYLAWILLQFRTILRLLLLLRRRRRRPEFCACWMFDDMMMFESFSQTKDSLSFNESKNVLNGFVLTFVGLKVFAGSRSSLRTRDKENEWWWWWWWYLFRRRQSQSFSFLRVACDFDDQSKNGGLFL